MAFGKEILVTWAVLAMSPALLAQATFGLRGTVVDATGAAIPGAQLRISTPTVDQLATAQSGADGSFTFPNLPPGDYQLQVAASSGFAAATLPVHVAGNVTGLRVMLRTEAVTQEVTVQADAGLSTDAAGNKDAVAVSGDSLRKLPVFDQDYIAALTPFLDASSGSSGGVTLIVDGVEVKSLGVSASAIQEVRINNDPYAAEYGRPGRGRIDITTKPGSPDFHGEGNFLFRDAIFNAKNHFALTRPPEARRIYEGHLSGPVGRSGHTSFIASATRREQDTAVSVDAVTPSGPMHQNVLTPRHDVQGSLRVTRDFSPTHRLSVAYNFEGDSRINDGVGGIALPEAGYNSNGREDDAIFNDRLILTPNLINQLQVTLEKDEDVTVSVTNAQSLAVSGAFLGGGAQADVARTENTIHLAEVMTWSHKKHYVRFGVQLPQFSRRALDDRSNRLGTFRFASLANFTGNTPYVFTQQQGPGRGLYWINEFGAFVQDQIKLSPRLQATLGLRYEWQTFLPDYNNFAPRLSLAYAPDKGQTVLRTGVGVFYDRTGGDTPAIAVLHNGVILHSVQLLNPTYPLAPGSNFANVPTTLVRFAPGIVTPYSVQYSVSAERQVHKGATVSAGYRGSVQVKSFRSRDANAPLLPPNPSLGAVYPRPDPNFGQIQQLESTGRSLLNALDVGFRGQVGRFFSGQAQYTLASFQNNTGGILAFPQDQYHPNAEWGRANQDQRHRLNLLGNLYPDHWLSLGIGLALYSGTPYTEITGNDDFHTGLGNSRPVGVGRNTLQADGYQSLDLLYNHDFQLGKGREGKAKVVSAGVSAFNVLNHTNYTGYIGTISSPLYLQPSAAMPGRQIQFSAGYRF